MNAILTRWLSFTHWASQIGGLALLGLAFLLLAAHQGTGIPSALLAALAVLFACRALPQQGELPIPVMAITAALVVSVALSAVVHPIAGIVAVTGLPFLLLGVGLTLGFRLVEAQRTALLVLVAGLALLCAAWGFPDRLNQVRPYEAWFKDYNSAATLFNLGTFASLALAARLSGKARAASIAAALVLMTAVVYSASRGGLLTLAAGLVLLGIHQRSTVWHAIKQHRKLAPVVLVGGSAGLVYLASVSGMADRLSRLGSDESTFARWEMWKSGWHMVQDGNWLTGYGLGMWMHIYPAYRSAVDFESAGFMAHNDYVQVLVEGGPLLLLSVLGVALLSIKTALSKRTSREGAALAAGVSLVCLHATFNFPFYNAQLALVMGLMLGIALATRTPSMATASTGSARWWLRGQAAALIACIPFLFWIALESVTGLAAFSNGTWPSRLIPNLGKAEVVSALFGEHGERALTVEPRKTLATHYLGAAVGKIEDSLEVRRATLNKAIALYASATEPYPGAYVPAQTHLLYRGIEAGLFDKAEGAARIQALLEPLLARFPNKMELHLSWADLVLLKTDYPTAVRYIEDQQKRRTSMDFDRKVKLWKWSRNPVKHVLKGKELQESGVLNSH